MEQLKLKPWPFVFVGAWLVFLLGLGGWWMYLVVKLANSLQNPGPSTLADTTRIVSMIKWEGLTFFICLLGISAWFLLFYFKDVKRGLAQQAFYAGLTHELKTPMASIKMQSDFLSELIDEHNQDFGNASEQIQKLNQRLQDDVLNLESHLDKALHLARIQTGKFSSTSLQSLDITRIAKQMGKRYQLDVQINGNQSNVMADEFALKVVLKNLLENTKTHRKGTTPVELSYEIKGDQVSIIYDDHGAPFKGDLTRLTQAFYKENSPKGQGIGLYLCRKMIQGMGGSFRPIANPNLAFELTFKRGDA